MRLNFKFNGFVWALYHIFDLRQRVTLETFQPCLLVVFDRTNLFEPNERFFQKLESSLGVNRVKKKTDSPGHNGLKLYNVLAQLRLATSKMKLNKIGIVLPYELPNDLI